VGGDFGTGELADAGTSGAVEALGLVDATVFGGGAA